ncbi:hypothetical protein UlMin_005509 [Ulmus minor]
MDSTFPVAEINEELNPGENKDFQVDPVSSQIANSLEIKEKEEAEENEKRRKKKKNKDSTKAVKKTIIVSGVVLAVAVAAFAITKKLKEK